MPVLSLCRMCQLCQNADKGANVSAPHYATPLPTNVTLYVRRGRWLAKNCLELSTMVSTARLCLKNPGHTIRTCNLDHSKTSTPLRTASEKWQRRNFKLKKRALKKICSCRPFLSAETTALIAVLTATAQT